MGYSGITVGASVCDPVGNVTSDYFEPQNFVGNIFKIGNAVFISCSVSRQSTSGLGFPVFATVFTLAEALCPKSEIQTCGMARNTKSGAKVPALITVGTDGKVSLESNNDGVQYDQVGFTVSYVV